MLMNNFITAAEQSWGSSAADHSSWVEQTSQPPQNSWADQTSTSHSAVAAAPPPNAWSTNTGAPSGGSQVPAPIPMPGETVPGQSLAFSQAQADSQVRGFE